VPAPASVSGICFVGLRPLGATGEKSLLIIARRNDESASVLARPPLKCKRLRHCVPIAAGIAGPVMNTHA
jgi:hypothetical protein